MSRDRKPEDRLPEDRNWVASTGLSRRAALAGSAFAAGFAAACQPVAAGTIRTDGEGVDEKSVHIPVGSDDASFSMPAFIARPKGGKKAPLLVVVHEIFGVHEWVKDMCRRFAKAGYYAIAPDLFARHGDASKVGDFRLLIDTIVSKTADAQVLSDIDEAVAFAAGNGGDEGRLGIAGFCWGGRIVWLYAAHQPRLRAGVAFYGRLVGTPTPLQPSNPIDRVQAMHAPVLGQYGGLDKGITAPDIDAMNARLKQYEKPSRIIIYPQADHGFMADYRPSYNAQAAKAAWTAALDWFGRYLR